jgi:type IV pilus assembly protein PilA
MLSRLRPTTGARSDKGFTLIELLVVMIIIGILAAIAIPVFLSQRDRAYESAVKSDLNRAATEVETSFVDAQAYPADNAAFQALLTANGVTGTPTVTLTYSTTTANQFCIEGQDSRGGETFAFDNTLGGLQASGSTC